MKALFIFILSRHSVHDHRHFEIYSNKISTALELI